MRTSVAVIWLVGCAANGSSHGALVIDGELRSFDAGALAIDVTVQDAPERILVVSTSAHNFDCDWARLQFGTLGGTDIDRRGRWHDAIWSSWDPDRVTVAEGRGNLLGGGTYSTVADLEARLEESDGVQHLITDVGDLEFTAEDCGAVE